MTLPGFVADASLYPSPAYRNAEVLNVQSGGVTPAYGPGECYDDCMATSRDGSRASKRFARFCATACG
jgi:hypothetical protein